MINYSILKDKLFNNVKGLEYEGKTIKKIDDCKKGYFPHKNGCKYMFFMEEDPNHRLIPILCEADRIVEPGYCNSLIERHNKVRNNYGKDYSLTFVIYSEEDDKFIVNRNRFDILFTLEDFKNYYEIILSPNDIKDMTSGCEDNTKSIVNTNKKINYAVEKSNDIYRSYSNGNYGELITQLYNSEFGKKSDVGRTIELLFNNNPIDEYDAMNMYFNYAEQNRHLLVEHRGLTRSEMEDLALRFSRRVNEVTMNNVYMSVDDAYNYIMHQVINKVFLGYYAEKVYQKYLIKNGNKVEKPSKNIDQYYGIDLIVDNNKYIQIKSFKQLVSGECIDCFKKLHEKAKNDYGYETVYAFYERGSDGSFKWLYKNNETETLFTLDDVLKKNYSNKCFTSFI
jgi:hypothetical protein